jgi:hypothetical protein
MMNERIQKLALEAGLLNYVDNETPRYYFVHADIEIGEIEKFARSIVGECANIADEPTSQPFDSYGKKIKEHFGVE